MAVRVELLSGRARLDAATAVLQRARLADATGGLWDAADVQWWWRRRRPTDDLSLPVWIDESGPCGAVVLTDWDSRWQIDALAAPDTVHVQAVWSAAMDEVDRLKPPALEVLAREDDDDLLALLKAARFEATDERSAITWMDARDRPPVAAPPDGFRVVDRASRPDRPHPMRVRNGEEVEARLQQGSLYDPELDLAVDSPEDDPVGYALFWFDATTSIGMLEPMRVEDEYQRLGLGRALLTAGLDRLAARGARRLKVGYDGEAGRGLYEGAGFRLSATVRSFQRGLHHRLAPLPSESG